MMLVSNPRAKPLAVVSFQDGVFLVTGFYTDKVVVCLTADTIAGAVKDICNNYIREHRRKEDG